MKSKGVSKEAIQRLFYEIRGGHGLKSDIKENMALLQDEVKMRARVIGNLKQSWKEMEAYRHLA